MNDNFEKMRNTVDTAATISRTRDFIEIYRAANTLLDESTRKIVKKSVKLILLITCFFIIFAVIIVFFLSPANITKEHYPKWIELNKSIQYDAATHSIKTKLSYTTNKGYTTSYEELEKFGIKKDDIKGDGTLNFDENGTYKKNNTEVLLKVNKSGEILAARKYNKIFDSIYFDIFIEIIIISGICGLYMIIIRKTIGKPWFSFMKWYRTADIEKEPFILQ